MFHTDTSLVFHHLQLLSPIIIGFCLNYSPIQTRQKFKGLWISIYININKVLGPAVHSLAASFIFQDQLMWIVNGDTKIITAFTFEHNLTLKILYNSFDKMVQPCYLTWKQPNAIIIMIMLAEGSALGGKTLTRSRAGWIQRNKSPVCRGLLQHLLRENVAIQLTHDGPQTWM